jgi:hypothetical protein
LQRYLADRFRQIHDTEVPTDPATQARLLQAAEQAKIALSENAFITVREPFLVSRSKLPAPGWGILAGRLALSPDGLMGLSNLLKNIDSSFNAPRCLNGLLQPLGVFTVARFSQNLGNGSPKGGDV